MEKRGELLNQLAIISDLIENLNTDSVNNILTLELKDEAFTNAFNKIQEKYGGRKTEPKNTFSITIGNVDIIFNKNNA